MEETTAAESTLPYDEYYVTETADQMAAEMRNKQWSCLTITGGDTGAQLWMNFETGEWSFMPKDPTRLITDYERYDIIDAFLILCAGSDFATCTVKAYDEMVVELNFRENNAKFGPVLDRMERLGPFVKFWQDLCAQGYIKYTTGAHMPKSRADVEVGPKSDVEVNLKKIVATDPMEWYTTHEQTLSKVRDILETPDGVDILWQAEWVMRQLRYWINQDQEHVWKIDTHKTRFDEAMKLLD